VFVKIAGNVELATLLMFAAQPFLGIMLGGSANYLVSLVTYTVNDSFVGLRQVVAADLENA